MVVKLSPFGGEKLWKMVIFVKKYVKMLKSKNCYLLKFRQQLTTYNLYNQQQVQ